MAWAQLFNVTDAEMSHHLLSSLSKATKRYAEEAGHTVTGEAAITVHYEAMETVWEDPETGEALLIPPQVSLRIEVPTEEN